MLQAIGALIPISLAMALSTVPLLATVAVLLSPKRSSTAVPYLLGYVVGMFLVASGFSAGLAALPRRLQLGSSFGAVELVLGIALIALAVIQWRRSRHREPSQNGWSERLGRFGPLPALGFALAMNVRPKALLLAAATGIAITGERLDVAESVVCLLIYTVLGSVTVTVPVVMTLLRPDRMSDRLVQTRDWIQAKSSVVALVVLLMVGATIFGDGLTRL